MVYKTPASCFPVIIYCVKMRKVESINFRFGGRSTSFCSSVRVQHIFVFVNISLCNNNIIIITIIIIMKKKDCLKSYVSILNLHQCFTLMKKI